MSQDFRDPAVGLSCDETPFYPPKTMAIADLPTCPSCTLILASPIAGTKIITSRYAVDGLAVDESPLTELTYNTNKYALYDTVIWKSGAHRDFKASANYDMEMNLYFRDVFNPLKQIAVAIPIVINELRANSYFTEMADQNPSNRTIVLEKIINGGPVVMYKGIDIRARNSDKPYSAQQCQEANSSLTWFILQPTYISANDAKRIRGITAISNVLPPAPQHELTTERARTMCSVVSTISIKSDNNAESKSDKGIYLTRALQCQRINPVTDIKDEAVYLNGTSQNSLQEELNEKAADSSVGIEHKAGIRPKQIEEFLAIAAGVLLGLLIFSIAVYYLLRLLYKGYLPNTSAMAALALPIITKKQAACASFVTPIILSGPAAPPLKGSS